MYYNTKYKYNACQFSAVQSASEVQSGHVKQFRGKCCHTSQNKALVQLEKQLVLKVGVANARPQWGQYVARSTEQAFARSTSWQGGVGLNEEALLTRSPLNDSTDTRPAVSVLLSRSFLSSGSAASSGVDVSSCLAVRRRLVNLTPANRQLISIPIFTNIKIFIITRLNQLAAAETLYI